MSGTNGTNGNFKPLDNNRPEIDTFLRDAARQQGSHETLLAYHLAVAYHAGVSRKSGEPFVAHPLYVARLLYDLRVRDDQVLASALLHDVIEDCSDRVSLRDLGNIHGLSDRTIEAVSVLTKRAGQSDAEYYARVLGNEPAVVVKLADRYHNLTTMFGAFSQEKMSSYVDETRRYVLPLADKTLDRFPLHASVIRVLRRNITEYATSVTWGLQHSLRTADLTKRSPKQFVIPRTVRRVSASLFGLLP